MQAILGTAILYALLLSGATAATIEARVSGVTGKGKINVAVCDKERFLKLCAYSGSAPARAGETIVKVTGVPAGTRAVLGLPGRERE